MCKLFFIQFNTKVLKQFDFFFDVLCHYPITRFTSFLNLLLIFLNILRSIKTKKSSFKNAINISANKTISIMLLIISCIDIMISSSFILFATLHCCMSVNNIQRCNDFVKCYFYLFAQSVFPTTILSSKLTVAGTSPSIGNSLFATVL